MSEASKYEWNESLPHGWVVQELISEPLVVLSRTGDESGLADQPQDQTGKRPGHDGPPEPL